MKLFASLLFLIGTFIVVPIFHIILINFVFDTSIPVNIMSVIVVNIIAIVSTIIIKILSQNTLEILTHE